MSMLFVLVSLWSVFFSSQTTAAQTERYVLPDSGNSTCPPHVPCHSLQHYADSSNFTSNSVFLFLEGQHNLSSVVEMMSVHNISLVGVGAHQNLTTILCVSAPSGFLVQEFTNLTLERLVVLNCGGGSQIYSGAFLLSNGTGLRVRSVTISNSSGYGIMAFSVQGLANITNSLFSANHATPQQRGGNAMFVYSSSSGSSHLFVNACRFLDGREDHIGYVLSGAGGLTVAMSAVGIRVTVINSVLSGNQGYMGGNLFFLFEMLTQNFVLVENVTTSSGSASRGAGIHVVLDKFLESNDPASCDHTHFHPPHYLMELNRVAITHNSNMGALDFEDRILHSPRGTDCAVQYVVVKNSILSFNFNASAGTALRFSGQSGHNLYKVLKTLQATFVNVTFAGNVVVEDNSNNLEYPPSIIFTQVVTNITFVDCVFENNQQTVISALSSTLIFQGTNSFRNNSGYYGTGISLMWTSYLYLKAHTHIVFSDNHANSVGGALYVEPGLIHTPICFFQVMLGGNDLNPISTISVDFVNNTADYAGSSIYGAMVSCNRMEGMQGGRGAFGSIFHINNTEEDPSAVTSDPASVCFCFNGLRKPNCQPEALTISISVFPGEDFVLQLAVVSYTLDGTVPGAIQAFFNSSFPDACFGPLQDSQTHDRAFCKNFTYTVFTTYPYVEFFVAAERLSFRPYNLLYTAKVSVQLRDCPLGFVLSQDEGKCVCDLVISRSGVQCHINSETILRPPLVWIGFVDANSSEESNETGVIFHDHCRFNYCLDHAVNVSYSNPNVQCVPHRVGLLCGGCEEGYSLTLGAEKCSKCSNTFLLLLLPLAVAGLLLVALLFALNLTVTEGSVNALIFYANVVEMARSKLYPGASTNLHLFVAWLNLDLGINSCFFDGMDAYSMTWLQFVFPLYLWSIIIITVLICNKSYALAASLYGRNSVKVLATVFLLSYTKLQRTVATIFSFTTLKYPNGEVHHVWLHDANVEFLKGKHLYLYLVGMVVLVMLIIPYTLGLTFFQHLQACSGHRAFRWVNKLKPVFDSYAGPYKDRYRPWTGFLLTIRTLLIILFSTDTTDSPDYNLFIIGTVSLSLLLLIASSGGIYKKWPYNVLESFFYLQLGIFAGGLTYASHNHGKVTAVFYFSYGSSLFVFLLIVGYHLWCGGHHVRKAWYRWKGYGVVEPKEDPLVFCGKDARNVGSLAPFHA